MANAEKKRAYGKDWRQANADRKRETDRKYRKAHAEKLRFAYATRKAARYEACSPGAVTISDRRAILLVWAGACAYCDAPATSMDHMTPLARGGKHEPGNIAPACGRCNSGKAAAMPLNFIWRRTTAAKGAS